MFCWSSSQFAEKWKQKGFSVHLILYLKPKWCDIEQKWYDLEQKWWLLLRLWTMRFRIGVILLEILLKQRVSLRLQDHNMERNWIRNRPLDLRTRTRTRFNLKFFCATSQNWNSHPRKLHCSRFTRKVCTVALFLLKEVKPSPKFKMIKVLTFLTCSRHFDVFAKTLSRMTTAITFSRQNDAGSRARTA